MSSVSISRALAALQRQPLPIRPPCPTLAVARSNRRHFASERVRRFEPNHARGMLRVGACVGWSHTLDGNTPQLKDRVASAE